MRPYPTLVGAWALSDAVCDSVLRLSAAIAPVIWHDEASPIPADVADRLPTGAG